MNRKVGIIIAFLLFSFSIGFTQSAIAGFPGDNIKIQNAHGVSVYWDYGLSLYEGISVDPTTGVVTPYGWAYKEILYYNYANVAVWYCENGDWHLHSFLKFLVTLEAGTDLPGETVSTVYPGLATGLAPTGSCVERNANNGPQLCPAE